MNYGNIKSHFKELLNRSDVTDAQVNRFITDGITRIQRQLRTPLSEKVKNYTITGKTTQITLPTDFIETISLYYEDREIRRVPISVFRSFVHNTFEGKPEVFTRQQANLLLHPQPTSGTLVLYYHGEFDQMSSDSDENALAQTAPDVIIYAGLTYAADFFLDERNELFEAKYNQFLSEIQEQSNDQELSGGTQVINPAYHFGDR